MAKRIHNVVDYGAQPDTSADSTQAIRDAAQAAMGQSDGGVVFFPAGVYYVSKSTDLCSVYLGAGSGNVEFIGEGHHSVIRSVPGQQDGGDYYVFRLVEAQRVRIANLCIDGNHHNRSNEGEQTHGIVAHKAKEVLIENVWFRDQFGDAIKFWGEPTQEAERVTLRNCLVSGQRRNGFTFQRLSKYTQVVNCRFWGMRNSSIDFEPTGADGLSRVLILGCYMDHTGSSAASVSLTNASHVQFVGNQLLGCIHSVNLKDSVIADNVIDCTAITIDRPCIDLIRAADSVSITGNRMIGKPGDTGINIAYNNGSAPTDVIVSNNRISARTGINVTGASNLLCTSNIIDAQPNNVGINVEARDAIDRVQISNNVIRGAYYGIALKGKTAPINNAVVLGNVVTADKSRIVHFNDVELIEAHNA